jgi:hypothetical protein
MSPVDLLGFCCAAISTSGAEALTIVNLSFKAERHSSTTGKANKKNSIQLEQRLQT